MSLSPSPNSQFVFVTTDDGSPTLRLMTAAGESESMHSLRGAFAETVYIYGTALKHCFQEAFPARVLSLGLGLGYVEILAAALALRDRPDSPLAGESFELLPELRDYFRAWATSELTSVPDDFIKAYDQILKRSEQETGVESSRIREFLAGNLKSGRWVLSGPLTIDTKIEGQFGCLCFDAFSSKTSPDLWTEPFLNSFFRNAAASDCVLSTYACTGALKRSLKLQGFEIEIRAGFGSKRDSTFAVRTAGTAQV